MTQWNEGDELDELADYDSRKRKTIEGYLGVLVEVLLRFRRKANHQAVEEAGRLALTRRGAQGELRLARRHSRSRSPARRRRTGSPGRSPG